MAGAAATDGPWQPTLPPGRVVELPGRGDTFIRQTPGPPGAPTVVLLHGWTVTADLNWFTSYETLGRRVGVVALDHRGHGQGLRSAARFRLADCADDVAVLCDVLGLDAVVPVGYSMGGPIALLTWHRHRELVSGLVLCATAATFGAEAPPTLAGAITRRALPLIARAGRLTPVPLRRAVARQVLGRRFDDDDFGSWARAQVARGDPLRVAEAGLALGRIDTRRWLGDIEVPTAVVRTTEDSVVAPGRQEALARSIPGASLLDAAGDHSACVNAPAVFVPALLRAVDTVTEQITQPDHVP